MTGRQAWTPGSGGLLAAVGALLLAGCGGDGPTDSDAALTSEEAGELAVTVARQAERTLVARTAESGPAGASGRGDSPLGGSILFSRSHACSLGGSATMAGRLERRFQPDTDELTVDVSMTIVHEGCVLTSGSGTLTLTGAPGLDVQAAYREVEGELDGPQRASVEGDVGWSRAQAGGTCRISLETVLDPVAGTLSIDGEACGTAVGRTVDR